MPNISLGTEHLCFHLVDVAAASCSLVCVLMPEDGDRSDCNACGWAGCEPQRFLPLSPPAMISVVKLDCSHHLTL